MALQQWADAAIPIAREMATGSVYSQSNRMGKRSYDCSSFKNRLFQRLGLPNVNHGATTTDMNPKNNYMRRLGFEWIPAGQGYQPGDVMWKPGHTEMYTGGRNTIGAHSTKNGVSEYSKQNIGSFHGGWRYVGDRFLGGGTGQGNYPANTQREALAQGMADLAVQQAVASQQAYRPTVIVQAPQEAPVQGFQAYVPQSD